MINLTLINAEEVYQDIKSGRYFTKELKIYSELEIDSCIRQFIEDEEYEKCVYLRNFKEYRFNHQNGYHNPLIFLE